MAATCQDMKRFALCALTLLAACDYEVVSAPNLTPAVTPESVAVEADGNLIVSDALAGRVLRIDPDTGTTDVVAQLPTGLCAPNPFPAILGAVDIDLAGNIYINANTCDPQNRGVYRIKRDGTVSLHVTIPPNVLANGLKIAKGKLFIVDAASDKLWSAPLSGGAASVFVTSPLFLANGDLIPGTPYPIPGANGIERYGHDDLIVTNSATGDIIRVPLDGSAPSVLVNSQPGCDDVAIDIKGRILCTTDPFQTITIVDPDSGMTEIVFDANADTDDDTYAPLDGPTDVTCRGRTCYVTNANFSTGLPGFPTTGNGASVGVFKWVVPAR